MKFRIKYADQIVGLFVILAGLLLVFILILAGGKQRWFSRDYRFTSQFNSGSGIPVGTPILYKGFQIGRIERIRLNQMNTVDVSLIIYHEYRDRVTENSLLELVTSPIGLGNQLLFHPGKSNQLLEEGSFIPSFDTPAGRSLVESGLVERPPKDDTITRLLSNVNPLVENINATVVALEKTLTILNSALEGKGSGPLAETVQDVATAVGEIRVLTQNLSKIVQETTPTIRSALQETGTRIPRVLSDIEQTTASLASISKNLESTSVALRDPTGLIPRLLDPQGSLKTLLNDNNQLFNRIDSSLAQIEQALTNLQGATAILASQMPRIAATIDDARSAIVSAQDVLEGLKNNPLLRGGIPERIDPKAAPTGLRNGDF